MFVAGIVLLVLALFVVMFVLPFIGIVIFAPIALGTLFTGKPILWILVALGAGFIVSMGWIPFIKKPLRYVVGLACVVLAIMLWVW
jgi:hypothetical protein